MNRNTQHPLTPLHTNIILASIADGVFTVDEHMKITYFNCAAERITGYTARIRIVWLYKRCVHGRQKG
jgi:PAS domain-containing protein